MFELFLDLLPINLFFAVSCVAGIFFINWAHNKFTFPKHEDWK